jgi:ABC-type bacteriocin/lantibiotic exporter with double-glycine peptidase domain
MNIVKQVNNNECGVCVIAMLYEHYYHDNKKLEILETSKVTENGLSIYDFETLASEFGIFIETFQID